MKTFIMKHYNLIVIGGGPGGYEAAALASARGRTVALIERDKLGGTCLNKGCVPTKCLCAGAEIICHASAYSDFGISGEIHADYSVAAARAASVADTLRNDVEAYLAGVDIVRAVARLGRDNTVVARDEIFKGDEIIIATGSAPRALPVDGVEYTIDSDEFLQLRELPSSLVIIGGGVIGLEFASVANAYGCAVTIIEYMPEILPGLDTEIAKRLRTYLAKRNIKFVLGAQVKSVAKEDGKLTVCYETKKGPAVMPADCVLCATGRRAVLPDGLYDAGVAVSPKGFIETDDSFRTSAPGIYAIGDVNGRCMLAHAASAQARKVMHVSTDHGVVPSIVFTIPECASVGLSVNSSDGLCAAKVPYSANSKALASGEDAGLLKLVYQQCDGVIVGCQAVGSHAGDLVAEATIAIDAGYTVERLANATISAHPSLSELLTAAAVKACADRI